MNCINCDGKMTCGRQNIPYRSLPGTTLLDIEVWTCPECQQQEYSIPALNELEQVLVRVVCEQAGRLAPEQIRFLRKHLGWSGVHFAKHFGVSPETVSRWENGAQLMSTQADRLLRVCATRLEPIDDYGQLEALLDLVGSEEVAERDFQLHRVGSHWQRAA